MIDIYTDGSCLGNPGPGGWAAIVAENGVQRKLSGGAPRTTNNRMELAAAIEGLESVPKNAAVTVHSDSQYLVNTMTRNWKRKVNLDLWARLDSLVAEPTRCSGDGSRATLAIRATRKPMTSPFERRRNSPLVGEVREQRLRKRKLPASRRR